MYEVSTCIATILSCINDFVCVYYRMFIMVGTRSVIDAWDTVNCTIIYQTGNSDVDLTCISSTSRSTLCKIHDLMCNSLFFKPCFLYLQEGGGQ